MDVRLELVTLSDGILAAQVGTDANDGHCNLMPHHNRLFAHIALSKQQRVQFASFDQFGIQKTQSTYIVPDQKLVWTELRYGCVYRFPVNPQILKTCTIQRPEAIFLWQGCVAAPVNTQFVSHYHP